MARNVLWKPRWHEKLEKEREKKKKTCQNQELALRPHCGAQGPHPNCCKMAHPSSPRCIGFRLWPTGLATELDYTGQGAGDVENDENVKTLKTGVGRRRRLAEFSGSRRSDRFSPSRSSPPSGRRQAWGRIRGRKSDNQPQPTPTTRPTGP